MADLGQPAAGSANLVLPLPTVPSARTNSASAHPRTVTTPVSQLREASRDVTPRSANGRVGSRDVTPRGSVGPMNPREVSRGRSPGPLLLGHLPCSPKLTSSFAPATRAVPLLLDRHSLLPSGVQMIEQLIEAETSTPRRRALPNGTQHVTMQPPVAVAHVVESLQLGIASRYAPPGQTSVLRQSSVGRQTPIRQVSTARSRPATPCRQQSSTFASSTPPCMVSWGASMAPSSSTASKKASAAVRQTSLPSSRHVEARVTLRTIC